MAKACQPFDPIPNYFPDGTRYVIEGEDDGQGGLRVTSRRIVFPDGREIHLSEAATNDERLWDDPRELDALAQPILLPK